jgi:hypothetical protein
MFLVVTILLGWFALALLTVGALNVWKSVVMQPSESSLNHRSAQMPTSAGARTPLSLMPQQVDVT